MNNLKFAAGILAVFASGLITGYIAAKKCKGVNPCAMCPAHEFECPHTDCEYHNEDNTCKCKDDCEKCDKPRWSEMCENAKNADSETDNADQ